MPNLESLGIGQKQTGFKIEAFTHSTLIFTVHLSFSLQTCLAWPGECISFRSWSCFCTWCLHSLEEDALLSLFLMELKLQELFSAFLQILAFFFSLI